MTMSDVKAPGDIDGLAHEVWAAAQLTPGEGIEDGVDRIASILASRGQTVTAKPSVPTQMVMGDSRNPLKNPAIHDGFTAGWNACREAMLNGDAKTINYEDWQRSDLLDAAKRAEHQDNAPKAWSIGSGRALVADDTEYQTPAGGEDPNQAQLVEKFSGTSSGCPNPFYRCKDCGTSVPGVHHYLVEHYKACTTPTAGQEK